MCAYHFEQEQNLESKVLGAQSLETAFIASFMLPLPLLVLAWIRSDRQPIIYSTVAVSALVFLGASLRPLKSIILGGDYSHRLYTTIYINLLLCVALSLLLAFRRRWIAAVATAILGLGWLLAGAINSAV